MLSYCYRSWSPEGTNIRINFVIIIRKLFIMFMNKMCEYFLLTFRNKQNFVDPLNNNCFFFSWFVVLSTLPTH